MGLYLKSADAIAPATASFDFNGIPDLAVGPFWVSFAFWVDTDDGAAGAFTCDINYTDPAGAPRVISGVPISLADPTGFYTQPVQMVARQSSSSLWTFDTTLIGSAGTALVSYRVMHFPTQTTLTW